MSSEGASRQTVASLDTPLGEDALQLVSLEGREAISQLFAFRLEAIAPIGESIDFDDLLGASASVSIWDESGVVTAPARVICGMISRVCQLGTDERYTWYSLDLTPTVSRLTGNRSCRIFEDTSVPDILSEVFGLLADVTSLAAAEPRKYCVQYDESDFAFGSRLIEEEGYYYYFDASGESDQMIVAEDSTLAATRSGFESIPFLSTAPTTHVNCIWSWKKSQQLSPASYTVRDWAFQGPQMHLTETSPLPSSISVGGVDHSLHRPATQDIEIFEYPGRFAKQFDTVDANGSEISLTAYTDRVLSRMGDYGPRRAQEMVGASVRIDGASNCCGLAPCYVFELTGSIDGDGAYLVTSVTHSLRTNEFDGDSDASSWAYRNTLTAIPKSLAFRSPRRTARPTIMGHQTATVVGAGGSTERSDDDIFTDKFGRVRVRFHWSRENANSCWLRVAQSLAGNRWGTVFIPRVGNEVVVGFENGDPDCPLIYGSVYNYDNQPPEELPTFRSRTALMSQTNSGANEEAKTSGIAFGETPGAEYTHLRSGGDMLIDTLSNQYFAVKNEQATYIDGSQVTLLGGFRGIDFTLFRIGPEIPFEFNFGDDHWPPVSLARYYFSPKRIDAVYGTQLNLNGREMRCTDGVHEVNSSIWALVSPVLKWKNTWVAAIARLLDSSGLTFAKLDLNSGDQYASTKRRYLEMHAGQSYVYAGNVSDTVKGLWAAYGLIGFAIKIIVGIFDVRDNTPFRLAVDIMQTIQSLGGSLLASIEMSLVSAQKAVTTVKFATDRARIAAESLLHAPAAALDAADGAERMASEAADEANSLLQRPDVFKDDIEDAMAGDAGKLDLYHFAERSFVVDTGGSIRLDADQDIWGRAKRQVGWKGNSIINVADKELALKVGRSSLVMDKTGIKLAFGNANSLAIDSGGISVNGVKLQFAARTSINIESGTETKINGMTQVYAAAPLQSHDM